MGFIIFNNNHNMSETVKYASEDAYFWPQNRIYFMKYIRVWKSSSN